MTTRGNIQGKHILAVRKKAGLSRAELATILEMPISTLKQYETDKRPIPGVVKVALKTIIPQKRPKKG